MWTGPDDGRASGAEAALLGVGGTDTKSEQLSRAGAHGLRLRVVTAEAGKGQGVRFACCAGGAGCL